MHEIKKIFLDLDGPLLDGKERHYQCYRNILESSGFKPIGIEEYWGKKRALLNRRDLLNISGAEEIYDDFLAAWLSMIETPDMLALDKVQEGAIDCMRIWREQGVELVLVTMRKNMRALEEQLLSTGLRQFLDAVLVSSHAEGGEGKANRVRDTYSTKQFVKNALWIGDTEADWSAAQSLGCDVVLVSNGLRNEEYLKSLGSSKVIPSIKSLKNEESRSA